MTRESKTWMFYCPVSGYGKVHHGYMRAIVTGELSEPEARMIATERWERATHEDVCVLHEDLMEIDPEDRIFRGDA